jgi:hypothetical protein
MKEAVACVFFLMLASCGYHFEDEEYEAEMRRTISVPYIQGDVQGQLTNEVIRQISHAGCYEYVREGGALTLKIEIVADSTNKIGYRYDRNEQTCVRSKNIQPVESRREVTVEVSLIDEASMIDIVKPTLVRSTSEYDFVGTHSLCDLSFINNGRRVTVESFSLGQLDSVEGAQDDTLTPLYRELARKIVTGIGVRSFEP